MAYFIAIVIAIAIWEFNNYTIAICYNRVY